MMTRKLLLVFGFFFILNGTRGLLAQLPTYPIILNEFINNKYSVLYDINLGHYVIVETHDGVPRCRTCNADDCGHVGFAICLKQKYDNDGNIFD